jgi:2-haloalkanoic acid dehalogenase type II
VSHVIAFDALGTLFDLGELQARMSKPLHHATSLTLAGQWLPLAEIVGALDAELAQALGTLEPFPDAHAACAAARGRGETVWVLTNGGAELTQTLLDRAGLAEFVAAVRSVEEIARYKPHPAAYNLLPGGSKLVAAHAWDVVGARAAGHDSVWVNRGGDPWPYPGIEQPEVAPNLAIAVDIAARSR